MKTRNKQLIWDKIREIGLNIVYFRRLNIYLEPFHLHLDIFLLKQNHLTWFHTDARFIFAAIGSFFAIEVYFIRPRR